MKSILKVKTKPGFVLRPNIKFSKDMQNAKFQYELALESIEKMNQLLLKHSTAEFYSKIELYNEFVECFIEKKVIDSLKFIEFLDSIPQIFALDSKDNYDSYLIVKELKLELNQVLSFLREYDTYSINKYKFEISKQYSTLNYVELYFDNNAILDLNSGNKLRYFRGNVTQINEYFTNHLFVKSKPLYLFEFKENIRIKRFGKFSNESDVLDLLSNFENIYGANTNYKLIKDSITKDFQDDDYSKIHKVYNLLLDIFYITATFEDFVNFAINGTPIILESNHFAKTKSLFDAIIHDLYIRKIIRVEKFEINGKTKAQISKSVNNFGRVGQFELNEAYQTYNQKLQEFL